MSYYNTMNNEQLVLYAHEIMQLDVMLISLEDRPFWHEFGSGLDMQDCQNFDDFRKAKFNTEWIINPSAISAMGEVVDDYNGFTDKLRTELDQTGCKNVMLVYAAQMAFIFIINAAVKVYRI